MHPIGHIRSPFPEKFGIPRQAGLAPSATSVLEFDPSRVPAEALRGIEGCSHVWVIYELHAAGTRDAGTVRPPRLGGNQRLGVLATRAPFRPNPIGLSAVRLLAAHPGRLVLGGGDFLDGTPVLDIKPYVPYADRIDDARCDWAADAPGRVDVRFNPEAESALRALPERDGLRSLITETLGLDPRPAYRAETEESRTYGMRVMGVNVRFRVTAAGVEVCAIEAEADWRAG